MRGDAPEGLFPTKASVAYSRYKLWAEKNGQKAENSTAFGRELTRLGVKKEQSYRGVFYSFALIDDSREEPDATGTSCAIVIALAAIAEWLVANHKTRRRVVNTPMTAGELAEILRLHDRWLNGDADLSRANLRRANLSGADLSGADLSGADLSGADLSGANLSRAHLRDADLSDADLSRANLRDADLSGAHLRDAELSDADLSGAHLRDADLLLIGQDLRGYLFYGYANEDDVLEIRAGCRRFAGVSAARAHWESRHLNDPVLHADCLSLVTRAETLATARGWKLEPHQVSGSALSDR